MVLVDLTSEIEAQEEAARRIGSGVVKELRARAGALRNGCAGSRRQPQRERVPKDLLLNTKRVSRAVYAQLAAIGERWDYFRQECHGGPNVHGYPHSQ